jgi:hypothetical protein
MAAVPGVLVLVTGFGAGRAAGLGAGRAAGLGAATVRGLVGAGPGFTTGEALAVVTVTVGVVTVLARPRN